MIEEFGQHLPAQLARIRSAGTDKRGRVIITLQGWVRIRAQISAAHSQVDRELALDAFKAVKQELKL